VVAGWKRGKNLEMVRRECEGCGSVLRPQGDRLDQGRPGGHADGSPRDPDDSSPPPELPIRTRCDEQHHARRRTLTEPSPVTRDAGGGTIGVVRVVGDPTRRITDAEPPPRADCGRAASPTDFADLEPRAGRSAASRPTRRDTSSPRSRPNRSPWSRTGALHVPVSVRTVSPAAIALWWSSSQIAAVGGGAPRRPRVSGGSGCVGAIPRRLRAGLGRTS